MFAPPDSLGGSADKINPDRLGVHRVWVRKNTAGHGPFSGLATCRHAALTAHGPGLAGASVLRSGRGTARHCNELPAQNKDSPQDSSCPSEPNQRELLTMCTQRTAMQMYHRVECGITVHSPPRTRLEDGSFQKSLFRPESPRQREKCRLIRWTRRQRTCASGSCT